MNKLFGRSVLLGLLGVFGVEQSGVAQEVAPLPPRTEAVQTWSDHRWTGSDGTDFHYVEQGEGVPVILIHGFTSSAVSNWFNTGIGQKLAASNRVIAIDMRGHGDTGPSPADSDGTMINDIIEFMDYLGFEQAHIGGYSMGGATTTGVLKIAPERFITASIMGIGIRETPAWQGRTPVDGSAEPPALDAVDNSAAPSSAMPLDARGVPRGAPNGAPEPNPEVDLTAIDFPVLALNGGNDRPLAKTHRMWRELKDFKYVVIPGRNHIEAPRDPLFGDALVRFIRANNPTD